jgi:hypothetical protein
MLTNNQPRLLLPTIPPPMSPSVRVKRRHIYSSIQDDDRHQPEQLHDSQLESGRRTLSEPGPALSPSSASGSLPPPLPPHDPNRLSSIPRRDMSRVNYLTRRSSVSYRSFAADLDSNPADPPPVTYGQMQDSPLREIPLERTPTDPAAPHPHRAHPPRVSRVRSALSSTPSGSRQDSRRDSDSDSESDSEDEDGIMEDDEHHHDDHVVDHLDVIGPSPSHVLLSISFLTLTSFIDPQVATVATLTNTANAILL